MPFDYSADEWRKIEEAVQAIRPGPLERHERNRLRTAAHVFRISSDPRYVDSFMRDFEKKWLKVAKLSEQLSVALTAAMKKQALNQADIERTLASLEPLKAYAIERSGQRVPETSPLQYFHQNILSMWVEEFGGTLATSKNARTDYGSPIIDFFLAVANPVRKKPLSRSSIDGIIDKEREWQKAHRDDG